MIGSGSDEAKAKAKEKRAATARAHGAGLAVLAMALGLAAAAHAEPPPNPELHARLRAGWERVAHGDLDGAAEHWAKARALDPAHPGPPAFQARLLQMRRFLDYPEPRYDDAIEQRTEEAIELAEAWIDREPESARARLFLGQAFYDRMLLFGTQRHYYKAGTNGEKGRKALERALELDPTLIDAKLPLGTYYIYASFATRYVGWLSFLWFIPTGERDKGLAYLRDTMANGDLFDVEAGLALSSVLQYLEDSPAEAIPLLRSLLDRYPHNSLVRFELIEALYASGQYQAVLRETEHARSRPPRYWGDAERQDMARVWHARALTATGRGSEALQLLDGLLEREALLDWTRRWGELVRGQALDLTGERKRAIGAYTTAREMSDYLGGNRVRELAEAGLEAPFRPLQPVISAPPPDS